MGHARSLKVTPVNISYDFISTCFVPLLFLVSFLGYMTMNNITTLKSRLWVTQGHWIYQWCNIW